MGPCRGQCQFSHLVPCNVSYKLDTGSQVNVILQKTYHALQKKPKLYTAMEKLIAYDGNAIPVIGRCIINLARKEKPNIPAQMFVAPTDSSPIIGLETFQRLNLIKRIEILNCDDANFMPSQDVFGEIGCVSGEHHIQIEENATPVIHPPRRVPYALMNNFKTELDRMKRLDIIEEIDEPTE